MDKFFIKTDRLVITEADESMAESIHKNSLDEDMRKFVPDEVFETVQKANQAVMNIMNWYKQDRAPLVYPIIIKNGVNIGYVQAVPFDGCDWEIGYHIAKEYTGRLFATEALKAFLPVIMEKLKIDKIMGISLEENAASCAVLEKCGFKLEYKGSGNYQGESGNIRVYFYYAL